MVTELITPQDRKHAKRIGRVYGKVARNMAFFFLAGLILTALAAATAEPHGYYVELQEDQSVLLSQFYGEAGEDFEFGFYIETLAGEYYEYQLEDGTSPFEEEWQEWDESAEINGLYELNRYMQSMEWLVQADLLFSESYRFESFEVITSLSGDMMISEFDLPANGYYKFRLTNLSGEDMTLIVGHASVNIALATIAVVAWVLFAITVAVFGFMLHLGWWILVIFMIVKAVTYVSAETTASAKSYNRTANYSQVIGPPLDQEAA